MAAFYLQCERVWSMVRWVKRECTLYRWPKSPELSPTSGKMKKKLLFEPERKENEKVKCAHKLLK